MKIKTINDMTATELRLELMNERRMSRVLSWLLVIGVASEMILFVHKYGGVFFAP